MRKWRQRIKFLLPDALVEWIVQLVLNIKILSRRQSKISTSRRINITRIGDKNYHTFFGYYDFTPFNIETDEIIYLSLSKKQPTLAAIVVHDLSSNIKRQVASSRAWNWQQGSRLRWLPNSSDKIMFNDYRAGKYLARIVNIRTMQEETIESPIYDVDARGKLALSLSFERLGFMRPGYGYVINPYKPIENLAEEGISLIDLKHHTSKTIITYHDINNCLGGKESPYIDNYINHLSFSPSGNKFLFFWLNASGGYHKAFLMVFDLQSMKMTPLETIEKVSHYAWLGDDSILCTTYDDNYQCRYYKYSIAKERTIVGADRLIYDGHPSVFSEHAILTDTYPDKLGFQKLLLYNLNDNSIETLLSIHSQYKINAEMRTDLHPRLDRTKTKICIDANVRGYREIFILG